jgi:hypothetical protein
MSRPLRNTPETVLARLRPVGTCQVWPMATNAKGYGLVKVSGRVWLVHRFVYESMVGPVPPSFELDHLCRNRACANPAHLEPVTHRVNVQRGESPEATRRRMTGRPGANSKKTHCKQGHPFDEQNTRINAEGERVCRTCSRGWAQRHRQRVA